MKNLSVFLFIAVLVSACGGKKTVSTGLNINVGALVSGAVVNGGIAVVGSNGSEHFSLGLSYAQAQSYSLDLTAGDWTFHAVAWDGGSGEMTGLTHCGSTTTSIEGSDTTVSLTLSAAACGSDEFSSSVMRDTFTYGSTTFKQITLNSCLNPVDQSPTATCDGSTLQLQPGQHISVQLLIPGGTSSGEKLPSLSSGCINLTGYPSNLTSGEMATSIRLPGGGSVIFPVEIKAYENANCDPEDVIDYHMPDGISGSQGVGRFIDYTPSTSVKLSFADNYIGVIGSPFFDANTNSKVMLPLISCGAACLNAKTGMVDRNLDFDEARDEVWRLMGSPDGLDNEAYQAIGNAMYMATNSNGGSLSIMYNQPGSIGNDLNITFTSAATDHNVGVSCDMTLRQINVSYGTLATPTEIASAIGSNCSAYVVAAPGGDTVGIFSTAVLTASGSENQVPRRRQIGRLNEVKHMMLGPLGALLYNNGITSWTQLCSVNGIYYFQLPNKNIALVLSDATSSSEEPIFGVSPSTQFERKMLLTTNGIPEDAYYFNCVDGQINDDSGVGAYVSYSNNDQGENVIEQVFWNVTTLNNELVEQTVQRTKNSNIDWHYSMFRKENSSGDVWSLWSMQTSQQYSSSSRLGVNSDGTNLNVSSQHVSDTSLDNVTTFFVPSAQSVWSYTPSSKTFSSGTGNAGVEIGGAPSLMPSYSIGDMTTNTVFWPLSY